MRSHPQLCAWDTLSWSIPKTPAEYPPKIAAFMNRSTSLRSASPRPINAVEELVEAAEGRSHNRPHVAGRGIPDRCRGRVPRDRAGTHPYCAERGYARTGTHAARGLAPPSGCKQGGPAGGDPASCRQHGRNPTPSRDPTSRGTKAAFAAPHLPALRYEDPSGAACATLPWATVVANRRRVPFMESSASTWRPCRKQAALIDDGGYPRFVGHESRKHLNCDLLCRS